MGEETVVNVKVNGESFSAKGLVILEKNYLEVYTYEKWGTKILPPLSEGQTLNASSLTMSTAKTKPAELLTEAELISLMDKHHIGCRRASIVHLVHHLLTIFTCQEPTLLYMSI